MDLKRIKSFQVDHTKLVPGLYLSRVDGDCTTYDLRMKKPNSGDFFDTGTGHTFEHLLATFVRSGEFSENIIYAGPMGCRTGFYLVVKELSEPDLIKLVQNSMKFISNYSGEIPGATERECGNYRDQNLDGAKKLASEYARVIENWSTEDLKY